MPCGREEGNVKGDEVGDLEKFFEREKFGFEGSRSEGKMLYNRIVPNSIGKQIKKHFPSVSVQPVEGKPGSCEVIVNSKWMGTVGKEFPLIIDGVSSDKSGKLHVTGEEPAMGTAFYGMR